MTTEQQIEQDVDKHIETIENDFKNNLSFGDRTSDGIASFGGSWRFVWWMIISLVIWLSWNTLAPVELRFDPFPFIFLNLCLSFIAAFQAPIIMMSQNRTSVKDRYYNKLDFKNNHVARLEIQELHQPLLVLANKVDDITEIHKESQEQIVLLHMMFNEIHQLVEELHNKSK